MTNFIPEKQISIDIAHSLDQLSSHFQTVKDGLPELIKNSKDQYARLGILNRENRQIIVLISEDKRRLGVLDFAGTGSSVYNDWQKWSSKTAGRAYLSADIEAGYGNGGKSFMVRGCLYEASMCSYFEKKFNKWGFINWKPEFKYRAGFFTDSNDEQLKDVVYEDSEQLLNEELAAFGISVSDLPTNALNIFKQRKAFTLVQLIEIREWGGRRYDARERMISGIPNDLMNHAQAALTIESSIVWVVLGDRPLHDGPLTVPELPPFEGFENVPEIPIPNELVDPETGTEVKTYVRPSEIKCLQIKTSEQNLRLTERLKPLNVIRVYNSRNIVSNWSIADLAPLTTSGFIRGKILCPALTQEEHLSGAARSTLVDTPLVRALKHWTAQQVSVIAREIQRIQTSRVSDEDRNAASDALNRLREKMKEYLKLEDVGGEGTGGNGDTIIRPPVQFGSRADEIVLEEQNPGLNMAKGTTVPLVVKCYEINDDMKLPVPRVSLTLISTNFGVVEQVGRTSIKGLSVGSTQIWFKTTDGEVISNAIEIRVLEVKRVDVVPPAAILKQGERAQITIVPYDENNVVLNNMIYEASVDEIEMGKIGRFGMFTAGGISGNATVRINYGENDSFATCIVQIGEERIVRQGGSDGPEIPYILLCGMDAPGREDLPEEKRSHPGGLDYSTIIDFDPVWEGIVWLNPDSHEAIKVRTSRGRSPMSIYTKTFYEFMVLKCFDILKRLKVREKFGDETKTSMQFLNALAEAEIETSGFLESAYVLVNGLLQEEGVLNED